MNYTQVFDPLGNIWLSALVAFLPIACFCERFFIVCDEISVAPRISSNSSADANNTYKPCEIYKEKFIKLHNLIFIERNRR